MPPILLVLALGSADVQLVVGFGVVDHSVAVDYPRNYGDPNGWSQLVRLNPSGGPCQGWVGRNEKSED